MRKLLLSLLLTGCVLNAHADIQQLATKYPKLKFDNIQPTELKGIYSATMDGQVVYLDEAGEHVMLGSMIRLKDQKNLTKDLVVNANRVRWSDLPLNQAIKTVKGNGQHQIAIFSDPNCPYCQKLEKELDQLNNVTVYTFLYPIQTASILPSKQVWCSASPSYTWQNLILRHIQPPQNSSCENPIQQNLNLGKKLGIDGTPGIIFSNGFKSTGFISKNDIEAVWKEYGI